jgi:hypothetical protein
LSTGSVRHHHLYPLCMQRQQGAIHRLGAALKA